MRIQEFKAFIITEFRTFFQT